MMKPKETLDSDCPKLSIPESAGNAQVVFAVSPAQPLWETVLERGIFKSKGGTQSLSDPSQMELLLPPTAYDYKRGYFMSTLYPFVHCSICKVLTR